MNIKELALFTGKSFLYFFAVIGIFSLIIFGYFYIDENKKIEDPIRYEGEFPLKCANKTLVETSYCFNEEVRAYFKYVPGEDENFKTWEKIKEKGGDCSDYSRIYEYWFNLVGYESEKIVINVNKSISHMFIVAHSDKGYCILDQNSYPKCFNYGSIDEIRWGNNEN